MVAEPPLPPAISAQLKYLLVHCPLPFRVEQIWSGCKNSRFSDRFTLLVPFCLDYIKWDVIYNAFFPFVAPDIVFSQEDEEFCPLLPGFDGEGEPESEAWLKCSSLWDWNSKDPSRLLKLVNEIRDLYIQHQRKRVGKIDDARLKFEINTILSREGIEVCLISGLDKVVFPISRKYSSSPSAPRIKLVASSQLKDLFSVEDVKLPSWVDGMCMAEYLPSLEDTLNIQIMEAVASIGGRRRFIEALAPKFGRPLEADPIFCRRATFLAVTGVFTFLVHFSLSAQFPKLQPTLTLQSSQHFNSQGAPILSLPLSDYPWSPRWDAPEMAERIFEFLVKECINFKKYCFDAVAQ
ncbi:hypothetical protein HPP92_024091 [Vanilla planifolia]|uniref:BRISC and BRCA1-A complex member 2 n=1 Tax=Vanilla planifolia TaxID=51239 RepID=A0A835PN96_VANPL|nr:hypothetical protein HPP92_024091 [Vanilla planifolia]